MARTRTVSRTTADDHLWLTDDPEHCALLAADANAFLIGYILDQQVTVQKAFRGPADLLDRIGTLEPAAIAAMPLDQVEAAFAQKPAIHRFPGAMAKRVRAAMGIVAEQYGGDAARIWLEASDYDDLAARLAQVPGMGPGKLAGMAAILTQRCGVPFDGWQQHVGEYGSLGDVDSPEALRTYQARKRAHKRAVREAAAGA